MTKNYDKGLLAFFLIISLYCLGSSYSAQDNSPFVEVPNPLSGTNKVYKLESKTEPNVGQYFKDFHFNTTLVRVTNRGKIRHEYARFDPFNCNQSLILLRHTDSGDFILYKTNKKPYEQAANKVRILSNLEEMRWDPTNANLLWGQRDFSIIRLNVLTGQETVIKDFSKDPTIQPILAAEPDLYRITMRDEGESSFDKRYWCLMIQGSQDDYRGRYLISWDRQQNKILGLYPIPKNKSEIDWVGMSYLGTYVLIGGDYNNGGELQGLTMANRELTRFHRLDYSTAHSDVGLDIDGKEVIVMQNTQTDYIDMIPLGWETKPILQAGGSYQGTNRIKLVRLYYASGSAHGMSAGIHISCNSPGFCLVSTYLEEEYSEKNWLDRSNILVKLDKTKPQAFYLAKVYNTCGAYWEETQATISNDGAKVIWTSNWNKGVGSEQSFLMQLDMPANWKNQLGGGTNGATFSLSRNLLTFGADTMGRVTPKQTFLISNADQGTLNWSVKNNRNWFSCSPLSGTNSAKITVEVDPSGILPEIYSGDITVEAIEASNSPQSVSVVLNMYDSGFTQIPFGEFATPQGESTVFSSVPVTGWVLDDIGVQNVEIFNGSSYIGNAVFVEGARPDVEAAYPDYPNNTRAGWGYMLLTNFLPKGGNGTYTLLARATDAEGHVVSLGSKIITVDNDHAVKPFGAIDTPIQGGTVSGSSYLNWGWVLTPQPNSIPVNGSSIDVWVDGANLGHPIYNNYRSDIADKFPGYANSKGAIGYFYLDTTAYSDGVHTIQWTATDSGGNTDGIGSRYFTIQNTGADLLSSEVRRQESECRMDLSRTDAENSQSIIIQKGFSQPGEGRLISADNSGECKIKIRELEPLKIKFPEGNSVTRCYQMNGKQVRNMPIGMNFEKNTISWMPGLAYLGDYRFLVILKNKIGSIKHQFLKVTIESKF
jgi:hypothetical protein